MRFNRHLGPCNFTLPILWAVVCMTAALGHTGATEDPLPGRESGQPPDPAPGILLPPLDRAEPEGTWVTLEVKHSLQQASYQWFKDGAAMAGADGRVLNIGRLLPQDTGQYSVVVSNVATVLSTPPATVTVLPPITGRVAEWVLEYVPASGVYTLVPKALPSRMLSGVVNLGDGFSALGTNGVVLPLSNEQTEWVNLFATLETPVRQATSRNALLQTGSLLEITNDLTSPRFPKPVIRKASPPAESVASVNQHFDSSLRLNRNGTVGIIASREAWLGHLPAGLDEVVAIALGTTFAAALRIDGSVVTWGPGEVVKQGVPSEAQGRVVAIAAGRDHLLALTSEGRVVAWGANFDNQCNVPATVGVSAAKIVASAYQSAAILQDGSVVLWGSWHGTTKPALDSVKSPILSMWASDNYHPGARLHVLVSDGSAQIIRHPESASPRWMERHELSAVASGFQINYQWWKDGAPLRAATNRTLVLDGIRPVHSGSYRLHVSNPRGSAWSEPANIRPNFPPSGRVVAWGANGGFVPEQASCDVIQVAAGKEVSAALRLDGRVAWWNPGSTEVKLTPPGVYHKFIAASGREPLRLTFEANSSTGVSSKAVSISTYETSSPEAPESATVLEDGSVVRATQDPTLWTTPLRIPGRKFVEIGISRVHTFGALDNGMAVLLKGAEIQPLPMVFSRDVVDVAISGPFHPGTLYAQLGSGDLIRKHLSDHTHKVIATGIRRFSVWEGSWAAIRLDGQLLASGNHPLPDIRNARAVDVSIGGFQNLALVTYDTPTIISDVSSIIPLGTQFSLTGTWEKCAGSFQWWKDGQPIPGATNRSLSTPFALPEDSGDYAFVVDGSISNIHSTRLQVDPLRPGTPVVWGGLPQNKTADRGQPRPILPGLVGDVISIAPPLLALKANGDIVSLTNNPVPKLPVNLSQWKGTEKAPMQISITDDEVLWIIHGDRSVSGWYWGNNDWFIPPDEWSDGVTQIVHGESAECAVKEDSTVICYHPGFTRDKDRGIYRMLTRRKVPQPASSGVVAAACDSRRIAVLKEDGSILVWNPAAERDDLEPPLLTDVPQAARSGVQLLAAGPGYFAAIRTNGDFVIWGSHFPGLTNVPPRATQDILAISAGNRHILTLNSSGEVFAWGDNTKGQTSIPLAARSGAASIFARGDESMVILGYPITLAVAHAGNELSISWPARALGYALETLVIGNKVSNSWRKVPQLPTRIRDKYSVRLKSDQPAALYRLVRSAR